MDRSRCVIRRVLTVPISLFEAVASVMNLSNRFILLLILCLSIRMSVSTYVTERNIGVCMRNCAQCQIMFGDFFVGEKCANFCVKYKGKLIPDCEDEFSIRPFLQKVAENEY